MISPKLLQLRLRRLTQLVADAVEGHGDARIEHVAQLAEDDAVLVTAQLRERHRGAAAARGGVVSAEGNSITDLPTSPDTTHKHARIPEQKERDTVRAHDTHCVQLKRSTG